MDFCQKNFREIDLFELNFQLQQDQQRQHQNIIMSQQSQKQNEIYQTFQKQTSASALPLPTSSSTMMHNTIPPPQTAPQQIQNWSAQQHQPRMPIPNLPMMAWPSRPLQQQVHTHFCFKYFP